MTPSKHKQKMQGQSSIAKKVYEFVPMKTLYSTEEIVGEMRRVTRSNVDPRIMRGCLNSLKDGGLIDEPETGKFKRIEVKEKIELKEIEMPALEVVVTQKQVKQETNKTPLELLSKISSRLGAVQMSIRSIADEIDAAAVEIEDGIQSNEKNVEKLRQLQALLKGLI